jgi:hypothetical protein
MIWDPPLGVDSDDARVGPGGLTGTYHAAKIVRGGVDEDKHFLEVKKGKRR